MARLPRCFVADQPQHVIQRGVDRQRIFFSEGDRAFYLECLAEASVRSGCALHAYVLMDNHVHLLASPRERDSVSRMMQCVGRRYVAFINYRRARTGGLWEGRFRSCPIDSERYLLTCYRYIELNPVRAGMVAHAGAFRWSSHRHNADGAHDALLQPHPVYAALGDSEHARRGAYRELFTENLDDGTLAQIRRATQKGWALGEEAYAVELEDAGGRRMRPHARGGVRENSGRPVTLGKK